MSEPRQAIKRCAPSRVRRGLGAAQVRDLARYWNVSAEERTAAYPCDRYMHASYEAFLRAVDIDAPSEMVFRWLCQLKVAPYSYDWIDNRGRRSPRSLSPGTENLELGQEFLVFRLVEFESNRHITGVVQPRFERVFGRLAVSYLVELRDTDRCRLVSCIDVALPISVLGKVRQTLLAYGDLFMMRKQLLTLKRCAEQTAERHANS
jgi:hypothetical protein